MKLGKVDAFVIKRLSWHQPHGKILPEDVCSKCCATQGKKGWPKPKAIPPTEIILDGYDYT